MEKRNGAFAGWNGPRPIDAGPAYQVLRELVPIRVLAGDPRRWAWIGSRWPGGPPGPSAAVGTLPLRFGVGGKLVERTGTDGGNPGPGAYFETTFPHSPGSRSGGHWGPPGLLKTLPRRLQEAFRTALDRQGTPSGRLWTPLDASETPLGVSWIDFGWILGGFWMNLDGFWTDFGWIFDSK